MPVSPKTLVSSLEDLYNLRAFYSKSIILSYININSIRNKLDDLKLLLGKSLDIICISETKLDETFPTVQFAIKGFCKPYRLDVTSKSGGLLLYVKANLPSKLIRFYNFLNEIQCIPIELNISTKMYVLLSGYRPPNQNINFFLDELSEALDIYSKHYENICIFGDFNATSENNHMINFMSNQCLSNQIKGRTCFKSVNGSTTDLFLTTNKYLFQKTNSLETGISDHHHLIATVLKTTYGRFPPKLLTYRSYEHSWNDSLKNKFKSEAHAIQSGDTGSLETVIIKSLNTVAPFKKRIVRGSNKPHITSLIRKEIMIRSRLKNKANKSGKEEDLKAYKKQRNRVLKLNRKAKKILLKSCIFTNDKMKNKNFWKLCKPFLQRRVRNTTKILR